MTSSEPNFCELEVVVIHLAESQRGILWCPRQKIACMDLVLT